MSIRCRLAIKVKIHLREISSTRILEEPEKLRTLTGPDEKRLREYLSMMEILADNRHLSLNLNLQETCTMLEINLEWLPSYQMGMEKGIEKGLRQALDRLIAGGIPLAQAKKLLGLD